MFAKVEVDSSLLIEKDENKLCDCSIQNGKNAKNAKKKKKKHFIFFLQKSQTFSC
jgi:hypothetical protein